MGALDDLCCSNMTLAEAEDALAKRAQRAHTSASKDTTCHSTTLRSLQSIGKRREHEEVHLLCNLAKRVCSPC
jgi:hypothetical protein